MHIAFLSVSDQLGGSEIALLEVLRGLRERHPQWCLDLVLPGQGPLHGRATALGVGCTVVEVPPLLARVGESVAMSHRWSVGATMGLGARLCAGAAAWPAYIKHLRRALVTLAPDVLHTNGLKAHLAGTRAAGSQAAVVWHLHEYVRRRPITARLLRKHVGACRAIIANSESVARDVTATLHPRDGVDVIPNAVDVDRFAPDGPQADLDALAKLEPPPAATVRVGLVGTFSKWKGHEVFLRAIASLPRHVRIRGYVVGEPLYDTVGSQYTLQELRSIARGLGVNIGFTGFVEGDAAMRALDIVVHASTEPEPFGLVIAEAMACGRAVITSGCGGAAELVTPGVDAVTHAPGDVQQLAAAIASLAGDATLRRQLGERARASAVRRFHPDRFSAAIADVYERVVSHGTESRNNA